LFLLESGFGAEQRSVNEAQIDADLRVLEVFYGHGWNVSEKQPACFTVRPTVLSRVNNADTNRYTLSQPP
jgi:hypothetical protein